MKRLIFPLLFLALAFLPACVREDGVLNTLPPWDSRFDSYTIYFFDMDRDAVLFS